MPDNPIKQNSGQLIARMIEIANRDDTTGLAADALREGSEVIAAMSQASLPPQAEAEFQSRVQPWMMACFGPEIASDKLERNDRFIEEALELVQAGGYDKARAHALVDYVFDRPQGDINQEVGGVMVTLAAHCLAHGVNMHEAAETELARIWTKVEQIRAKQAAKPTGSALPIASPPPSDEVERALQIGDPVRCVTMNCPEQWRDDWVDWTGFVAGIQFDWRVGRCNYTVCDHWPPKHNGELTDGFYDGMLTSAALTASRMGGTDA